MILDIKSLTLGLDTVDEGEGGIKDGPRVPAGMIISHGDKEH